MKGVFKVLDFIKGIGWAVLASITLFIVLTVVLTVVFAAATLAMSIISSIGGVFSG